MWFDDFSVAQGQRERKPRPWRAGPQRNGRPGTCPRQDAGARVGKEKAPAGLGGGDGIVGELGHGAGRVSGGGAVLVLDAKK